MKFKILTIILLLLAVIDEINAQEFGERNIFLCVTEDYYEETRDYFEVCNNTCDDRGWPFHCPAEGCGNCDKYLEKLDPNAPVSINTETIYETIKVVGGEIDFPKENKYSFTITDPNWFGETVVRLYSNRTELVCETEFLGACLDYDCETRDPDIVRDYIVKRYRKNFTEYADIVDQTLVAIKNMESGDVAVEVPIISNQTCVDLPLIGEICAPIIDGGEEYAGLTTADEYKLEVLIDGNWQILATGQGAPPSNIQSNLSGVDFGQYAIRFSQRSDCNGDVWWTQAGTIDVVPSCYNDNAASLGIGGVTDLSPEFPNVFLLEETGTFPIVLTGLTDFDQHYEMTLDGENEYIQLDTVNKTITISNDIPNVYKLFIKRKPGRESCLGSVPDNPGDDSTPVATLTIMVNGEPLVTEQLCPIILPDDLFSAGDSADHVLISEVFPVQATSGRSVIVEPGMILSSGATLTTEAGSVDEGLPSSNESENYVLKKSYDTYGRMTGAGITYFDALGRAEQQQYIDIGSGQLMTSEKYYDGYGRGLIASLTAPIGENSTDVDCPDFPIDESAWVAFEKKLDFAPLQSGAALRTASIEEGIISPLDTDTEGTLGYYYGTNSQEHLLANTKYPLVQAVPKNDGTGAITSEIPPGDFYRQTDGNAQHIASSNQLPVSLEDGSFDRAIIDDYLALYAHVFPSREVGISNLTQNLAKKEFTDADNRKSFVYKDKGDMNIISLVETENGFLSGFNYYDTKSRLVAQISPNGVEQFKQGIAYEAIDKSTYEYNYEGFLLSATQIDGGRSEYRYAKDGRIRFSQNELQREEGKLSYTHYDESTRPVESGEFIPNSGEYQFDGDSLMALLDKLGEAGEFHEASGQKQYINRTIYDLPQANYPLDTPQEFLMGAVAVSTYCVDNDTNPDHKTYYSYDERGRLTRLVQEIKGLGVKTISYLYAPNGNVKEVAYQRDSVDQYYHYYEYDKDNRLAYVYSGTVAPVYNSQLEITNKEQLIQQATYDYYLHGPLKRMEMVQANQGIDYLYTADGKLKAINWADPKWDPGEDVQDVFGMTLNYHPEDYRNAKMPIDSINQSSFPDEAQYSGNIQAQEWHSPVDGNQKKAYSYSYDKRKQLKTANFGNTVTGSFADEGKYDVNIGNYDENGNIKELNRTGETGSIIHDLTYKYSSEGNRLDSVMQGDSVFRTYEYNTIGQMISQTSGNESMYVDYDVTGKLETVYANDAKTDTVMHIQYDDKGFRLSKTSFDSTYQAQFKTWYVRDASGTVMNIYVEALQANEEPIVYETPIYGSGRLGAYRPSIENEGGEYYYEVKDHLGNVRVVIGGRDSVNYLATMEDERAAEEIEYFSGLKSTTVGSHLNHTPESEVTNADRAVRINNVMDTETQPIGGAITLRVFPGDTLKSKVYAKYEDNSDGTTEVLTSFASFLATAYGMPVGGEGVANIFDVVDQSATGIIGAKDNFDDSQPDIYLNYLLYDDDFNLVDFGIDPISTNAEIPADPTAMTTHAFDELANEIIVEKPGFVYIYISNEDERNITAYFDDFEVQHTYGNIAVATDQYPFGLAMEGRKLERKYWRYGYQGEYAEKDKETQWNAFQLRMFDPVIGRWTTIDPYGQYPSPYLGMGNNPISRTDPDGGRDDIHYDSKTGETRVVDTDFADRLFVDGDLVGYTGGHDGDWMNWGYQNVTFYDDYNSSYFRDTYGDKLLNDKFFNTAINSLGSYELQNEFFKARTTQAINTYGTKTAIISVAVPAAIIAGAELAVVAPELYWQAGSTYNFVNLYYNELAAIAITSQIGKAIYKTKIGKALMQDLLVRHALVGRELYRDAHKLINEYAK